MVRGDDLVGLFVRGLIRFLFSGWLDSPEKSLSILLSLEGKDLTDNYLGA